MNVQQRKYLPVTVEPQPQPGGQQHGVEAGLFDVLQFALRRKFLIIFSIMAGLVCGYVYLAFSTPIYTASMRLLIDTRNQDTASTQADNSFILDTSAIDSQVELIRSPVVLSKVAATLKLHEVPEFNGTAKAPFDLFVDDLWSLFGYPPAPVPVRSLEQGQRIATAILGGGTTANRVGRSYIIQISFRSPNRQWAARVANAIGEAYIEDQLEAKYSSTRRAGLWMQERINELRNQANLAEREVLRYKTDNNIIDTGGGLLSNQELSNAAGQLMAARAQSAETKVRLDRLTEIMDSARNGRMPEATVSEINSNPIIARLRNAYVDIQKRELDIATRFGRDHIQASALRGEMRGLQESMLGELRRVVETSRSDHEIALSREAGIRSALDELVKISAATGEAKIPLRELEVTAQSYRTLYDSFLGQQTSANQRISFPRTEAREISPASTPWAPSEPNANRILLLALLAGGFAGVGAAFAREQLDRVFRTPAQVERVLGLDSLGILPIVRDTDPQEIVNYKPSSLSLKDAPATPSSERRKLMKYVIEHPFSRFAETLRSVKVTLELSGISRSAHTVGFVSGMPNEGKTTVSCNFAVLVAGSGLKTLLMDLDMRNPSLSRRLAPDATAGLLEVLRGEVQLEDVLVVDKATGLQFLPIVSKAKNVNTSELLSSAQMELLVITIREKFQYIVMDLPPLAPIVDTRAAVNLVDNFVLVIEWGKTRYDVLLEALKSAPEVKQKILGAVLNKTDMGALRRYDTHRDSYYENKYYKRYGYEN